jgi:hypothetical protein
MSQYFIRIQAQWKNLTRARFATEQTFSQYSPISVIDQVKAPLMIIAGKQQLTLACCVAGGCLASQTTELVWTNC